MDSSQFDIFGKNGAEEGANTSPDSVSGIVDTIVYANEDTGYAVFEIEDSAGDPVTITGTVPYVAEGDKITAYGKWINHPTYGRQFVCEAFEKGLPESEGDILRYLSSGAVKGIGPRTAQRIVERFGTDTFDVLENHSDWLSDIPGVSAAKAQSIGENFRSLAGARSVMLFCSDYFSSQTSMRIYKKWGSAAVDKIKSNPYKLCEDFRGISFKRADQIAVSLGLDPASEERIIHGAVFVLRNESSKWGHTCLPYDSLVNLTCELLCSESGPTESDIKTGIENAVAKGLLVLYNAGGVRYIFDPYMYNAEKYIAAKLTQIEELCPAVSMQDSVLLIQKCEAQSGIEYAAQQRKALLSAMTDGVMILTGGPGTGKTTIIKGMINIFKSLDYDIALAAPTGRAAKRMSEATSERAMTIHRLLEVQMNEDSGSPTFMRNEDNPLDESVVIIDEASMLDVPLMQALLRAMKKGGRLILIGDSDQLPSVGAGNVLGDLIESGRFTLVRLNEIFRQSENSYIITNAHRINEGQMPELGGKDSDFFFMARNSDEAVAATVTELVSTRLAKAYGEDIRAKIQVITPSRKGLAGTENLNAALQSALNPPSKHKAERRSRDVIFRVGDRVMQTRNDYGIEWTSTDGEEGQGIFNGDIGVVTGFNEAENLMLVRFDDSGYARECALDFTQIEDLDHAYAVTVHKSQGSEYPVVIIPIYSFAPLLRTRNLIYTAVTRASKMVIIVGNRAVLAEMIANGNKTPRCTMLKEFLK